MSFVSFGSQTKMTSVLVHLITLFAVAVTLVDSGAAPPEIDLPPPPPIPPPPIKDKVKPKSPAIEKTAAAITDNATDSTNTTFDIVDFLGNGTQFVNATDTTVTFGNIFANDNQTNQTIDGQLPLTPPDAFISQGQSDITLVNDTLLDQSVSAETGKNNDSTPRSNMTLESEPFLENITGNITDPFDTSNVTEPKEPPAKPDQGEPTKVDLPPPPAVFEKLPSVAVKDTPGSTTIEITGIEFGNVTANTTETQFVTTEATPILTTTIIPDQNQTTNVSTSIDIIDEVTNTSTAYPTTTVSFVTVLDAKPDKIKTPTLPVDINTLDNRAPDLPPPIFVPEVALPPSSPTGTGKIDFRGPLTETNKPAKVTAQPPPPPIIFTDKPDKPKYWIDPRMQQSAKPQGITQTTQRTKQVPLQLDPKYMSVSELAYYTLLKMERDKQRKKAESAAKGMGVQVFFDTLQPFVQTLSTTTPSKPNLSTQALGFKNSPTGKLHIQTTQSPPSTISPLQQSPTAKPFYGADYLMSQYGIKIPYQPPNLKISQPKVNPRPTVRPFKPSLPDSQPIKDRAPATQLTQNQRLFFDSSYLLNQIGLTTPQPKQRQNINVQNIKSEQSVANMFKPFYINPDSQPGPQRQQSAIPIVTTPTVDQPARTIFKPFYIHPDQKRQNQRKAAIPTLTTPKSVIKPFPHEIKFRGTQEPKPISRNVEPNILNKFQRQKPSGIQFQRRGQVHTRPIDWPTNAKTQPFIDYNLKQNRLDTVKSTNTVKGINNININQNIPKPVKRQFNIMYDPSGKVIRYIYGSVPLEKHSQLWKQTHKANNLGMNLREKFNKRLKQEQETDNQLSWLKPPPEDSVQFGKVESYPNRDFQSLSNNQAIPKTGSEIRRNFNTHVVQDSVQDVQSKSQQPPLGSSLHSQFPLASKLSSNPQVSQVRTSALTSNLFEPMNFRASIKTLQAKSKYRPTVSNQKDRGSSTQTHWSAPQLNRWSNNVANVPYILHQFGKNTLTTTTEAPFRYIVKTTSMSPSRIATTAKLKPTLGTTVTYIPTTTFRTTTTTATTLPTVPPTADPRPPPVFDTKVLQTFMPFPKGGETTDPTVSKENIGWVENKTDGSSDGRCSGCVFVNDRCLLPDPLHCNLYIECVRQGGQVRAFHRECAIGAFFDRKSYLCVDPKIADCPTDRCREPGVKWYPVQGHCKHYWSCGVREGGSAFAQSECCPDMGGFMDGEGCVENPNCTDSCGSIINTNAPTGCKLRKTSSPTLYYDENAKIERPCAPGTLFNELQCTCVQDVVFERSENRSQGGNCTCTNDTTCACRGATQAATGDQSCSPFLALTFDGKTIQDSSNTKQHIGTEGVFTTKAGEGIFNGGGKLVLWRYANLMIPLVFAVRMKFLAISKEPRFQTLMANCDKNGAIEPTFDISVDTLYNEVIFHINTLEGPTKRFKIMFQPNEWASVDMIYDGERIVGSVNRRSRNIFSGGGIETRPFPLSIGGCTTTKGFKGLMDNVYIYEQCIPDEMYGIFMSVLE